MNNDKITKYIDNVEWDDVKNLNHIQNRIYLEELEKLDDEIGNSSYVYLTIFSGCNIDGKDRYIGSDTLSTTKSFMETEYTGTPKLYKQEFEQSLSEYEYRVLCLKVGEASEILNAESEVLKGVDARGDDRFFNGSNISGGVKKTLYKQIELCQEITDGIENGFKKDTETVDVLYHMPRAQPRQFDISEKHINEVNRDILGFHGKDLVKYIRPTILLEDYYGPGNHKRGGNTHTIEAVYRPNLKNKVKELEVVFIPKELWSKCTKNTIRDILRWDNANRKKITSKDTDQDEIIESCFDLIIDYDLEHTDQKVKDKAKFLGATESDWLRIRPKLKDKVDNKNNQNDVPEDQELIKFTDGYIKKYEDDAETDVTDTKLFSTIITGNSFNGWDFIISWLLNPKNKKRRLHGDFYGGKDNLKRYAEAWPEKQKWLIPKIENLFKAVDKKGHFTWDTAKRFQRKKNKIHD